MIDPQWQEKARRLRQWPVLANVVRAIDESPDFLGGLLLGSLVTGSADELSDIDLIAVVPNGGFSSAWDARGRLHGDEPLATWDEMSPGVPEAGAHKWLSRDLVLVECLIATATSGVRLAEPYAVVAGDAEIAHTLTRRPPISRSEMRPTASQVENCYDAFKAAVREVRRHDREGP